MREPIRPDSPDDPRLAPYMNLRQRTLRGQSLFIAEGSLVVERLLRSPWHVESVCMTNAAWQRCSFHDLLGDTTVYIIDDKTAMDTIVGFDFHQGVLALGKTQNLPDCVQGVLSSDLTTCGAWVVLPRATKPENLGLAFRSAAALNAKGVLLGQQCCDPFSRRALRVSMGGVLQVPVFKANDLGQELATLRQSFDMTVHATVLDETAQSLYAKTQWAPQTFFLFGNEFDGLSPEEIAWADEKLVIPMNPGVDSLNLGVSVGVFLYEYNRNRANGQASAFCVAGLPPLR